MLSLNHSTCQQLSLQHPLQLQSQPLSFWAGSSLSIDESRHLYRLLPPSSNPLLRILTKCIVLDERCEMSFYVQSHAFSIPVCFFSPGLPYHSHWPHLPILVISPYLLNNIGEIACETDSGLNVLISKCAVLFLCSSIALALHFCNNCRYAPLLPSCFLHQTNQIIKNESHLPRPLGHICHQRLRRRRIGRRQLE